MYLNGYAIFRKDQFEGIERDDLQEYIEKILTREKVIENDLGISFNIELKTWRDILLQLKERDIYIIAECEKLEESLFVMGKIATVHVNTFTVIGINEIGRFNKNETVIKYKDLTLIKFGDRYIGLFKKYIDS